MDEDAPKQEIKIDGVRVMEVNISSAYGLILFANSEDFPHLDKRVEEYAETHGMENRLAMVTYYRHSDSGQDHILNCSTWKPDAERMTWDADRERIAGSDDEARQIAREVMGENINHFRELDKQVATAPEKAQLERA